VVVMDSVKSYPSPSVVVLENLGALCRTMLTYIGGTKILGALGCPIPFSCLTVKACLVIVGYLDEFGGSRSNGVDIGMGSPKCEQLVCSLGLGSVGCPLETYHTLSWLLYRIQSLF